VKIPLPGKIGTIENRANTKAVCFRGQITRKMTTTPKKKLFSSLSEGDLFRSVPKLETSYKPNHKHSEKSNVHTSLSQTSQTKYKLIKK
jgi:hypothetical protein